VAAHIWASDVCWSLLLVLEMSQARGMVS